MKTHIHRQYALEGSKQRYVLLVDGEETITLDAGETKTIELTNEAHTFNVKSYLPDEVLYNDTASKILQKITHPTSQTIDLSGKEGELFLCIKQAKHYSFLAVLYPLAWLLSLFNKGKKFHRIVIESCTQAEFLIAEKASKGKPSNFLGKSFPHNNQVAKIIQKDVIVSVGLLLFGIYLIYKLSGTENIVWGWLVLLSGTGGITRFYSVLVQKKTIDYHVVPFYAKCSLNSLILIGTIFLVFPMWTGIVISILFFLFYVTLIISAQKQVKLSV